VTRDGGGLALGIRLLLGDEHFDPARQQRVALVEGRGAHVHLAPQLGGALRERLELLAPAAIALVRDQLGPAGRGEALAFDLHLRGGGFTRGIGGERLLVRFRDRGGRHGRDAGRTGNATGSGHRSGRLRA